MSKSKYSKSKLVDPEIRAQQRKAARARGRNSEPSLERESRLRENLINLRTEVQLLQIKLDRLRQAGKNYEGDSLSKIEETHKAKLAQFRKQKLIVDDFQVPLFEILMAISNGTYIKGVDIKSKVQNPGYRFISQVEPALSSMTSDTIATMFKLGYELGKNDGKKAHLESASRLASEKRTNLADEFATNLHPIIKKLQMENQVDTVRATIELLNKENVKSFTGKNWHLQTYSQLKKRWKDLGLDKETGMEE